MGLPTRPEVSERRDQLARERRGQLTAPHLREDASVREIVQGITEDARDFFNLQVEALKLDVRKEIADTKVAAAAGLGGAAIVGMSVLLLLFALAQALAYYTALPTWAGFAIVGLVLALGGAGLLLMARARGKQVEVPPAAIEEAKEDIAWIRETTSA